MSWTPSIRATALGTSVRIGDRGQRHEMNAVRTRVRHQRRGQVDRQGRLAGPAGAGQRQTRRTSSRRSSSRQASSCAPGRSAADDSAAGRRGPEGGVRETLVSRPGRASPGSAVHGLRHILEHVRPRGRASHVSGQGIQREIARGLREQIWPPCAAVQMPRRPMYVQPGVALAGVAIGSPVWTPIRTRTRSPSGQAPRAVHAGADRARIASCAVGTAANVESPVGIDHHAVIRFDGCAQSSRWRCEHGRIAFAKAQQMTRRAFDVAEEEGDGSVWKLRHASAPRAATPPDLTGPCTLEPPGTLVRRKRSPPHH